jgi:hypothetical protein
MAVDDPDAVTEEQLWAIIAEELRSEPTGSCAAAAAWISEIGQGEGGKERFEEFMRKFNAFVRSMSADPAIQDAMRRYDARVVADALMEDFLPDSSTNN